MGQEALEEFGLAADLAPDIARYAYDCPFGKKHSQSNPNQRSSFILTRRLTICLHANLRFAYTQTDHLRFVMY